jgi:hypothetical protein
MTTGSNVEKFIERISHDVGKLDGEKLENVLLETVSL